MNEQAIRFRLGIFVLGALLLLGVLIILFGGFPTYFRTTNTFTVIFESAPGLSAGSPVRRSGVRIGEVRQVTLDDDTGKVHVVISVDADHTLRQKDTATLTQGVLGGDVSIDFVPQPKGKGPGGVVEPGSILEGSTRTDTGNLVAAISDVVPPAKSTLGEAEKVFKDYDKLAPLIEDTLKEYKALGKATREVFPDFRRTNDELQLTARNWTKVGETFDVLLQTNEDKIVRAIDRLEDTLKRFTQVLSDENQKNLSQTLKNVRAASDRFDDFSKELEEMFKETRKTLQRVNDSLRRSDDVLANMQKATKPLADRSDDILKNLDESTAKLNRILGDLKDILQATTRGDGTLQRLLNDPGLYNKLTDSLSMFNRILPRVDRALRDMEIFADKIARHPEALGLGGVVRPGSGLKTPPTALPWKGAPPNH